jgi:hypothetical protein
MNVLIGTIVEIAAMAAMEEAAATIAAIAGTILAPNSHPNRLRTNPTSPRHLNRRNPKNWA